MRLLALAIPVAVLGSCAPQCTRTWVEDPPYREAPTTTMVVVVEDPPYMEATTTTVLDQAGVPPMCEKDTLNPCFNDDYQCLDQLVAGPPCDGLDD